MYEWLQRLFGGTNTKPAAHISRELPEKASGTNPESKVATEPAAPPKKLSAASWQQRDDASANFHDWLFENSENSELDTNPLEQEILDALDGIVKSKQSGANLVRRMPGLIPQLLQSLRSENFSGAELSRKISHDVVVVAAVIRLANSCVQNPGQPINSIEHAVLAIGQDGLRQLITGVAFKPIIDMNSGHFTRIVAPRIWEQSERCAFANRLLAQQEKVDPFDAFLAGLIQHVGLIVSLRIMDQVAKDNKSLGSAMFCSSLLRYARILSCSIGKEWNFSEAVTGAIEQQGSVYKAEAMAPVGKVLSLGDYLSKVAILVANNRLTEGDPRLFSGLSGDALACYRKLKEFESYVPPI